MRRFLPILLLSVLAASAQATHTGATTVPVLMLSDIHFDPFADPTLVPKLAAADVKMWPAILDTPSTADTATAYAQLQKTCGARGSDTNESLLNASLTAEHAQVPAPLFITVSGDLMAHKFDCRYETLLPKGSKADASAFAAKTVAYVVERLRRTFPKTPMYFALGNNDSGCKDYLEDANSAYLKASGDAFSTAVLDSANAKSVLKDFSVLGDYRVELPAPFHDTRLLVMQDLFESKTYTHCDGKTSDTEAAEQIGWLRKQLDEARSRHKRVWVMAHIPPGVDAYNTAKKAILKKDTAACAFGKPDMFLANEAFADVLSDYGDVISLVLLGHTHMDEMRLFATKEGGAIPGKLVPSISPVNGNTPAFTVAKVNARTATLNDYTVYIASNLAGSGGWSAEYTYSSTYGKPDYSSASLKALTSGFLADTASRDEKTQSYESFFFPGVVSSGINLRAAALTVVWPAYACSVVNDKAKDFVDCACPAR
jgi:sphingomyelin phosphodiesterase acid-like 3